MKCKEIVAEIEDYGQAKIIHERIDKFKHLFFYKEADGYLYIEFSDTRIRQKDSPETFDAIMYIKIPIKKMTKLLK
jgi:hypothetical protein